MDLMHAFLALGMVLQVGLTAWAVIQSVWSLDAIERSQERIAEMANRNERMTQSILQKVFDMNVKH
jgi:hypothetical protein